MIGIFLTIILLHGAPSAWAKHITSGASIDPSDFVSCMETSVQGNNEGKCLNNGESNQCVGLKRAIEDYDKNTKCFQEQNGICLTYGHLQNTQMRWLSTAAGHLALFHVCIETRYGKPDDSNVSPAINDAILMDLLRKIDDGSSVFGLQNGSILKRSLEGERLGTIIANSPEGRKIPAKDIQAMKDNANNPIVVDLENIDSTGGSNPATEGDNWNTYRPAFLAAYNVSKGAVVTLVENKKDEVTPFNPVKRNPAANPNINYKQFRENPYSLGLDTGIFDRVSAAYQRKLKSLQGIDEYVHRSEVPKDIKIEIKKGAAYEL